MLFPLKCCDSNPDLFFTNEQIRLLSNQILFFRASFNQWLTNHKQEFQKITKYEDFCTFSLNNPLEIPLFLKNLNWFIFSVSDSYFLNPFTISFLAKKILNISIRPEDIFGLDVTESLLKGFSVNSIDEETKISPILFKTTQDSKDYYSKLFKQQNKLEYKIHLIQDYSGISSLIVSLNPMIHHVAQLLYEYYMNYLIYPEIIINIEKTFSKDPNYIIYNFSDKNFDFLHKNNMFDIQLKLRNGLLKT